jgi:hypothetical protein
MAQEPLLVRGGLTDRIYVVTRYKVLDAERGRIEAITKYDVTEQYEALKSGGPSADRGSPAPRPETAGGDLR